MINEKFIKELLVKIGTKNKILIVPVIIDPQAKEDDCFPNVLKKVEYDGGSIIYGWLIHLSPFIYEAERHAVWLTNDDKLIDITPKKIPYKEILFVQDNDDSWSYNGDYINNLRINITNNKIVDDYIVLNEILSKLYQTGERDLEGVLNVKTSIAKIIDILKCWKEDHEKFMYEGGNLETLCYCCSSKPYKSCIGLKLDGEMKFILEKNNIDYR